jgi:hypothetical protein
MDRLAVTAATSIGVPGGDNAEMCSTKVFGAPALTPPAGSARLSLQPFDRFSMGDDACWHLPGVIAVNSISTAAIQAAVNVRSDAQLLWENTDQILSNEMNDASCALDGIRRRHNHPKKGGARGAEAEAAIAETGGLYAAGGPRREIGNDRIGGSERRTAAKTRVVRGGICDLLLCGAIAQGQAGDMQPACAIEWGWFSVERA